MRPRYSPPPRHSRWQSSRQTAEAAAAARRAVALEPSNWRHLFRLGHATWGEERLRAARGRWRLYPDFAFAHFQSAMVHVARGHLTRRRNGAQARRRRPGSANRARRTVSRARPALAARPGAPGAGRRRGSARGVRARASSSPSRTGSTAASMRWTRSRARRGAPAGRAPAEAIDSFQRALALVSGSRRRTSGIGGRARRAAEPTGRSRRSIVARPIEAALVRAQILTARHDATAPRRPRPMLNTAPPGFAGWTVPVEPFLKELHRTQGFAGILTRLENGRAKSER